MSESNGEAGRRLIHWIGTFGWKGRLVPIEHLDELRGAVAAQRGRGGLDETLYQEQLAVFADASAEDLPGARTIIVIAVPTPPMRLWFRWRGGRVPAVVPPTYVSYRLRTQNVQEVVGGWLERAGLHAATPELPLKTLAVRSGLAEYGRNNVTYVPGLGSFLHLVGLFSDLPCSEDPWRPPRMLERCERCEICRDRCPTGAIAPDRFLLRAERCLTLHNESEVDFPAWIEPPWHNCLFGCLLCQDRCPENGRVRHWMEDRAEFSEEETALLLERVDPRSLPAPLAAKLEDLGLSFGSRHLGRNLAALIAARERAGD